MGSIPARANEFVGTLKTCEKRLVSKSSHSVVVSTEDFESSILGSSPSESLSTFVKVDQNVTSKVANVSRQLIKTQKLSFENMGNSKPPVPHSDFKIHL